MAIVWGHVASLGLGQSLGQQHKVLRDITIRIIHPW